MNIGQAKWACLSHRSLEGGTRVQQIIIGYFVAPISWLINYVYSSVSGAREQSKLA